jgi:hypothetical protein
MPHVVESNARDELACHEEPSMWVGTNEATEGKPASISDPPCQLRLQWRVKSRIGQPGTSTIYDWRVAAWIRR